MTWSYRNTGTLHGNKNIRSVPIVVNQRVQLNRYYVVSLPSCAAKRYRLKLGVRPWMRPRIAPDGSELMYYNVDGKRYTVWSK